MEIRFKIKRFNELSSAELYEVLQLRSEVFVVEQNRVYQDELTAYSRLFDAGNYFDEASIGRVIVRQKFRKFNFGHELMRVSIAAIEENFNQTAITISAQEYLKKFYESHGFIQTSESYLEDDIPHIQMKRS